MSNLLRMSVLLLAKFSKRLKNKAKENDHE
jgi:hypothetical protein